MRECSRNVRPVPLEIILSSSIRNPFRAEHFLGARIFQGNRTSLLPRKIVESFHSITLRFGSDVFKKVFHEFFFHCLAAEEHEEVIESKMEGGKGNPRVISSSLSLDGWKRIRRYDRVLHIIYDCSATENGNASGSWERANSYRARND